jgi:hypothetical protein
MYDIIAIFDDDEYNNLNLSEKILAVIIILLLYIIIIPIKYIINISLFIRDNYNTLSILTLSIHIIKSIGYLLSALIYFSIISIYFTILTIPPINILKIIHSNQKIAYLNKENKRLLSLITEQNKTIEDKNLIITELEMHYYSPRLLEIRQNIINALKIQLEDKIKIIENLSNKCTICYNTTINHCCVPCGHTYCSDCINKTNNCYICRGIIRNKIKLFF